MFEERSAGLLPERVGFEAFPVTAIVFDRCTVRRCRGRLRRGLWLRLPLCEPCKQQRVLGRLEEVPELATYPLWALDPAKLRSGVIHRVQELLHCPAVNVDAERNNHSADSAHVPLIEPGQPLH